ncbi:hypothetical protein GCM10023205_15640 [Yinghuangia aomiensis]|uniref:Uncharacterized protein n=1 Tax=Yinghuangia aomiensis TaxID=676205 RepID=A0ABP9GZN6_9ACTN
MTNRLAGEGTGVAATTSSGPATQVSAAEPAPLVRPYIDLTPVVDAGVHPADPHGIGYAVKVRIVAWGVDARHAGTALQRADDYARNFGFIVLARLASYGTVLSAAPLVDTARRRCARREVDYGQAWWIVPHFAISPDDFERAANAVRARWAAEAAAHRELRTDGAGDDEP